MVLGYTISMFETERRNNLMPVVARQFAVGTRFFRWETLTEVRLIPGKKGRYAKCKCDCGTIREVLAHDLATRKSVSCKCYNKEVNSRNKAIHGDNRVGKQERIYSIWKSMKTRCNNSNVPSYARYGGRGISVCNEWANSYATFRLWAKSSGYQENLEIDRRDNNGNYCPENCRWVTPKQNANNKQQSVWLTAMGETKTMLDWSIDSQCKVLYGTLSSRISRGWKHAEAITLPSQPSTAPRKRQLKLESELT